MLPSEVVISMDFNSLRPDPPIRLDSPVGQEGRSLFHPLLRPGRGKFVNMVIDDAARLFVLERRSH